MVGERGEAIDDAGHAAEDADLVAHQALGIAASVHALVVLLDAAEDQRIETARLVQDREAVRHVLLRRLELLVGEAALLVEELARQADLADVQQQPDLRELRELRLGEPEVAAEGGDVDRDLQAVAVGADVLLAQLGHPHEGLGVAHDALDHVVDDFLDALDLEGLAEADVGDELVEQLPGLRDQLARARRLLLDRGGVGIRLYLDARRQERGPRLELLRRLGWRLLDRYPRSRGRELLLAPAAEESAETRGHPSEQTVLVF